MCLLFVTLLATFTTATASTLATSTGLPLQQSLTTEPCAQVSASSASYLAATPTATTAIVDGTLVQECLQSIPLNQSAALDLLHSLEPYIELQSTLDYLADPPPDWPHPPVDIKARLQTLIDDVACGKYTAEYDFQAALYRIFLSAHDGHFSFIPDLFGVAAFKIPGASLVSISSDGNEPPNVYFRSDIVEHTVTTDGFLRSLALIENENPLSAYYAPSPIISINGIPTATYLSARLDELPIPFHDADAAYNFLFFEIAQTVQFGEQAGQGAFPNPIFYPGPETVFGLANGSTISIRTTAEIHALADFDGVKDGVSAYRRFCVRDEPVSRSRMEAAASPLPSPSSPTSTADLAADLESGRDRPHVIPDSMSFTLPSPEPFPLYPSTPIVTDTKGRVAGYHLNDTGTAVLVILNYAVAVAVQDENENGASDDDFQATVARFLDLCNKEEGGQKRKRLIIDLFANGGGTLELGIDTAVQIFPDAIEEPAAAVVYGNMRASQVLDDLGRRATETETRRRRSDDHDHDHDHDHRRVPETKGSGSLFDVRSLLTVDGRNWTDWDELFEQPGLPLYNGNDMHERMYTHEHNHNHNYNHTHIHDHEHEHEHGEFENEPDSAFNSSATRQRKSAKLPPLLTQTFQFNPTTTSPPGLHKHMHMTQRQRHRVHDRLAEAETDTDTVFAPENIVILTDGYCASTCAVFVELLTTMTTRRQQQQHAGRVRTVAIGGRRRQRPEEQQQQHHEDEDKMMSDTKMQILGATKGAAFWSFREILKSGAGGGNDAMRDNADTDTDTDTDTDPLDLDFEGVAKVQVQVQGQEDRRGRNSRSRSDRLHPFNFTDLPLRRTMSPDAAGVNGVNHIQPVAALALAPDRFHDSSLQHEHDEHDDDEQEAEEEEEEIVERKIYHAEEQEELELLDGKVLENVPVPLPLPLQFTRKDADFHMFLTQNMLVRKDVLWERVRDVVFGD
ncbi:hypothetical protein LTR20_009057 [Exophiala xenobiotica]|nr:hypothetical protein LTS13_007770 [Exophiala xenobiotica]KAK5397675.1 hypothetical protein LTR79_005190 [Exophiala xenobiotica]KAK5421226.1 hypothetical protein LTR90_002713 [Exophiala xenobiotica]KAK5456640.1 hypothetical protein LTR20_009057 [Exophiala xenobiotica]KAK5473462.1 hypothetical protein LTR26_010181 [Exophiala xenobiotica]